MISDSIKRVERETGSLHDTSYFEVDFNDGSTISEKDVNWSDISEEATVATRGGAKVVMQSKLPVSKFRLFHNSLSTEIDIPEDCKVYQAFKSEALFMSTGEKMSDRIIGRVVGVIKDGEIIEERYLDALGNQVIGYKK